MKQLFQVTEKLIKDQTEICGLTTIDDKEATWRSTTPLCDKAIEITNAKTYVFADSVLCLGSIRDQPDEVWKNKIMWYLENRCLKDLSRINGEPTEEPTEFEWKMFPGFTTLGILEEIQKILTESQCEPEQFKGRIIFVSLHNDTRKHRNMYYEFCYSCELCSQILARTFGHFCDLDPRRSGTELILKNQMETGTRLLN